MDIPAWIESVGTDAAFIVVAVTLGLQMRDKRGEQASKVDFDVRLPRVNDRTSPLERRPADIELRDYDVLELVVSNGSGTAVNDVLILMPFGKSKRDGTQLIALGKIPPGDHSYQLAGLAHLLSTGTELPSPARLVPTLQFRDNAGRLWQRSSRGTLQKIGRRNRKFELRHEDRR